MFNVFSTALSALSAMSTAIDVTGNNLANMNTTGYKESVAYFQDLVSESMNGGQTQVGFGVASPLTIGQFTKHVKLAIHESLRSKLLHTVRRNGGTKGYIETFGKIR